MKRKQIRQALLLYNMSTKAKLQRKMYMGWSKHLSVATKHIFAVLASISNIYCRLYHQQNNSNGQFVLYSQILKSQIQKCFFLLKQHGPL